METRYITPFIDTTIKVCDEFLSLKDVKYETPQLLEEGETKKWDISGIIGLAGEIRGMVMIAWTKDVITKVASNIFGKEFKDIDEDVVDLVGEAVNIIAGNAKKGLEEFKIMISLPSVIVGDSHKVFSSIPHASVINVPFQTQFGKFSLLLYFESENKL